MSRKKSIVSVQMQADALESAESFMDILLNSNLPEGDIKNLQKKFGLIGAISTKESALAEREKELTLKIKTSPDVVKKSQIRQARKALLATKHEAVTAVKNYVELLQDKYLAGETLPPEIVALLTSGGQE